MKDKSKKIGMQRELKEKINSQTVAAIKKASNGYGKMKVLSDVSGVTTNTIRLIKKERKATPTIKTKILNALVELEAA
jgi:hypothetical protein